MTSTARFFGIELDRRGIALLVGIGGTLVVGAIALQITIPQYSRLQELDTQISQKTSEINTKQAQLAQLPALMAQRRRSAEVLASVTALIPTADKLPSLLIDTTRLVKASNADLRKFTPGEVKAIPELAGVANIQSTSAKVSLSGNFAEVLTLMRNIERLEELLRIENITLKPVEKATAKTPAAAAPPETNQRLVAEFDLTAYVLDNRAPAVAPATADAKSPAKK